MQAAGLGESWFWNPWIKASERGLEAGRRESVFALSPDRVFRKGRQPPDILAQQCDKDSTSTAKFKSMPNKIPACCPKLYCSSSVKISTYPPFPKLPIGVAHNASGSKLRGPYPVCETRGPPYFGT